MKEKSPTEIRSCRKLQCDYSGNREDLFAHSRLYHEPGDGVRESIQPTITRKLKPKGPDSEALRTRVIIPGDAPDVLEDPLVLVQSYESNLRPNESTACLIFTFRFPNARNTHGPFQQVNSWLWNEVVDRHGVCAISVFHAPWLAGSNADPHVHAIVLPAMRLGQFGWLPGPVSMDCLGSAVTVYEKWHPQLKV